MGACIAELMMNINVVFQKRFQLTNQWK